MNDKVYSIDEIAQIITPIAQKHGLAAVYLFGSYARGEATPESDVDLLVDLTGSTVKGLGFVRLFDELQDALGKPIDLVTTATLARPTTRRGQLNFRKSVSQDRRQIYAVA